MKTKQKKSSSKKQPLNTFAAVHGVCPELVNLIDYMTIGGGSCGSTKTVTLGDVEGNADNIVSCISQLVELHGADAALSTIEHLEVIPTFCC